MRLWIYLFVFSLFTAIVSKTSAVEHIAQKGDNIAKIMRTYGIEPVWGPGHNVEKVLSANDEMLRQFPGSIEVGQVINIPDELIQAKSSITATTIRAKTGQITVSELTQIEKKEIAIEEQKLEKTLSALHLQLNSEIDQSLDSKQANKVQKNIGVTTTQPQVEPAQKVELTPDMEAQMAKFVGEDTAKEGAGSNTMFDLQIEPLDLTDIAKLEKSPIQKATYKAPVKIEGDQNSFEPSNYAIDSKIAFSPFISRMRVKDNSFKKPVELKEEDGSGIGIGFELELQQQFKTMINYVFQEIKFGKLKDRTFKQQGRTQQSFDLKFGYKPSPLVTIMATSSMVENFVLFEIHGNLLVQTSWAPAAGIEIDFSDTYRKDRARWRLALGAQHISRQQIGDKVIKFGTRSYAHANFTTKMYDQSFFRINLGLDHLDQKVNRGQQFSNQTAAGISFGSEF